MGKLNLGNVLQTATGIGSIIPGPWTPWAKAGGAILGGIQGAGAAGSAERGGNNAVNGMQKLTDEQIAIIRSQAPLLGSLTGYANEMAPQIAKDAMSYDPRAETEDAMRTYDKEANSSVLRDYGNAQVPLSLRGLQGSSEASGQLSNVAAMRSSERGQFAGSLRAGESGRKAARLSSAFGQLDPTQRAIGLSGSLSGPAGNLGNIANFRFGQANQFDPSGYLSAASDAFKGIKFPWQKTVPIGGTPPKGLGGIGRNGL